MISDAFCIGTLFYNRNIHTYVLKEYLDESCGGIKAIIIEFLFLNMGVGTTKAPDFPAYKLTKKLPMVEAKNSKKM